MGRGRGHDRDGSSAALIVRAVALVSFVLAACASPDAKHEPVDARSSPPAPPPSHTAPADPAPAENVGAEHADEPLPAYVPMPNTPRPPSSGAPSTPAHVPGPTPEDEKECKARGGKMQQVCMMGSFECVLRYRDGGKRCTDKSECTGYCIYEGQEPAPKRGTGVCQRTSDPCGCRALVVGGSIQPTMCFD